MSRELAGAENMPGPRNIDQRAWTFWKPADKKSLALSDHDDRIGSTPKSPEEGQHVLDTPQDQEKQLVDNPF